MDCALYKVSVPGSLMVFGEHAVLHNKHAVVVAVNHYIKISLVPNFARSIKIISPLFGNHLVTLDGFRITKPYDYVLTAIKQYLPKIKSGFTLTIDSDFPADIGFGSSAAVTVATLAVLNLYLNAEPINFLSLYRLAVKVIRSVQGLGSGADVAASVFGGVIAYKMRPFSIKRLGDTLPLVAVYSGKKVATAKVVTGVTKRNKSFQVIFANLYEAMDRCTREAVKAIQSSNWLRLGELMDIHQGLQDALGVNNPILSELIFALRSCPNIYGAKISGSGLGDCVVGLGKIKKNVFPSNGIQRRAGVRQIAVAVSSSGLNYKCICSA